MRVEILGGLERQRRTKLLGHRLALDGPSMRDPKTVKSNTTTPGQSAADTTVTRPATGAKK
jgi:hypothetical protein